ncbi:hypothetical protein CCHR01_10524 [Colletotrichum chrysophilum]|uniref:Alcohol dehydrogenase-like C-terminal domain-containing protein n=1 Tax=Colletotrichum chrysophilum TaxID=1836956 RepID=A0AAD9AEV8_9PEZI|nr:hypothetical protein CCHR01_10524 [Colletotrichum chrysophilum]
MPLPNFVFDEGMGISPWMYTTALCSGAAALRALKSANPSPGDVVIVSGVCGGIGHLAGMMARNVFKAKVIGIDLAWKAEALGSRAADTFDEFIAAPDQATDWDEFRRSISDACQRLRNAKEARRNADYLIVTSGCETAFEGLIDYVCDGGSVICVGLQGLLMGGWDESYEVMEYIREGKLRPLVVETCLEEVPFRMKAFKDHLNIGKVVVRMDDSIWHEQTIHTICQFCPRPGDYGYPLETQDPQYSLYVNEEEGIYDHSEGVEAGYCRNPSWPSKTVVHPAPSYDGAPTFVAYSVFADTPEHSETALRPLRPPLGIAVYDTTQNAHPARSARLARAVFDRTSQYRQRRDSRPDRIEVITLPLSLSLTDAERAEICVRHHEKEVRSRMLMLDYGEAVSWFLPGPIMEWQYARKIFAVNRLDDNGNDEVEVAAWEESLNEAENIVEEKARWNPQASPGSFLTIEWQPRKDAWQIRLGSAFDPKKDREMVEYCYGIEALGHELMELTAANSVYYSHFVGDGVLDFLLKKARLE